MLELYHGMPDRYATTVNGCPRELSVVISGRVRGEP